MLHWYGFWLFVHHFRFAFKDSRRRDSRPKNYPKSLTWLTTLVARIASWWRFFSKQKIIFLITRRVNGLLSFSLLLNFEFFAENCCDFAGHESPRYSRVSQRTFFSWRTVNFSTRSLKLKEAFLSLQLKERQRISLTCRLMLSRLHGKQNLWWATEGHWTKWVSSNRSWQIVPASEWNYLANLFNKILGLRLTFQSRIDRWRGEGCRYAISIDRLSIDGRCWIINISWRCIHVVWRIVVVIVWLRLCFSWCHCCTWNVPRARRSSTAWRS